MAIVAKWLTHRIVAPALVGSIPIVRPTKTQLCKLCFFIALFLIVFSGIPMNDFDRFLN